MLGPVWLIPIWSMWASGGMVNWGLMNEYAHHRHGVWKAQLGLVEGYEFVCINIYAFPHLALFYLMGVVDGQFTHQVGVCC